MAIAVPFIASALGASTLVSVGIGVAFSVTGINDKINKAASNVFGEDLVKFANIAGAGFAMWNGGFDIGSGAAEAAGGEILTASTPELTADAWAAEGAANTAALNEAVGITDGVTTASSGANTFNLDSLSRIPELGDDGLSMLSGDTAPTPTTGTNLLEPAAKVGADSKLTNPDSGYEAMPPAGGAATQTPSAQAITPDATANVAARADATTPTANNATQQQAARPPGAPKPPQSLSAKLGNVFDKVLYNKDGNLNERLVGGLIQGAGSAWAGANANRLKQQQYEEELRRRDSMPTIRYR